MIHYKIEVLETIFSLLFHLQNTFLYDTRYRFLIKKRENLGIKHLNDPKKSIQILWMIFKIILMITTQQEEGIFQLCLMT